MKSEKDAVWNCAYCDKEFKYESEKRRHELSHVPQFECKVCSKKFSFVSALRRHEKQHERTESVQCSKCGRRFKDDILLKRHIQYAHKGTYKCQNCTAKFNSGLALRSHMKTHKPESERKFRCSYKGCSKTFNFKHHLKHHELTHTDVKPHICMVCEKRFIQLHHLKIHQRVHKPDSWLMCTVLDCNKEFTNEYALRRHIATHKNKTASKTSLESTTNSTVPKMKKLIIEFKPPRKDQNSIEDLKDVKDASEDTDITKEMKELTVSSSPDIKADSEPFIVIENSYQINDVSEMLDVKTHDLRQVFKIIDTTTAEQLYTEFDNKADSVDENIDINDIDLSSSNCQTILGKCIVTGDTETNENCLCAQISNEKTTDDLPKNIPPKNNKVGTNLIDNLKCIEKRRMNVNACETCECASTCGIRDKAPENDVDNETPEFESRDDGIIKIKDTYDIEFENIKNESRKAMIKNKTVVKASVHMMTSCKDILGNCIVSGDGTIGEGCLCARMTADDQQIIAQEIEDITPCPSSWYK